mgnify:CR=1 FL=1|jgi:hypothetical protein
MAIAIEAIAIAISHRLIKKTTMEKREIWKIVIQTLITILTAIGTSLGVVSCM